MKFTAHALIALALVAGSSAITRWLTLRANPQQPAPITFATETDSRDSEIIQLRKEADSLRRQLNQLQRDRPSNTVAPSPKEISQPTPSPSEDTAHARQQALLLEFDRNMDREFARLEICLRNTDTREQTIVTNLMSSLKALDAAWIKVDSAQDEATRTKGRQEAQQIMGSVIALGAAHRNYRLGEIARRYGITDDATIVAFTRDTEAAMRETHFDWSKIFNRGQ